MSFRPKNKLSSPLFQNSKIIKLKAILAYTHQLNESFSKLFTTAPVKHNFNTRGSSNKTIIKSITNSVTYVVNFVKHRVTLDWNAIIKHISAIGIDRQELMINFDSCTSGFDNSPTWRTYVRLSYRRVRVTAFMRKWSRTRFSFSSRLKF